MPLDSPDLLQDYLENGPGVETFVCSAQRFLHSAGPGAEVENDWFWVWWAVAVWLWPHESWSYWKMKTHFQFAGRGHQVSIWNDWRRVSGSFRHTEAHQSHLNPDFDCSCFMFTYLFCTLWEAVSFEPNVTGRKLFWNFSFCVISPEKFPPQKL